MVNTQSVLDVIADARRDVEDVIQHVKEVYSNIYMAMTPQMRQDNLIYFVKRHYHSDPGKYGQCIHHMFFKKGDKAENQESLKISAWKQAGIFERMKALNADQFLSCNGFIGRSRKEKDCFQINGIFLDLDDHSSNNKNEFDRKVWRTLIKIYSSALMGVIPYPTTVVFTGRGLHIYYDYERSVSCRQKPLVTIHKMAVEGMYLLYQSILDDKCLSLDVACKDISRMCRVPGSYNTACNCVARIVDATGPYCTPFDLVDHYIKPANIKLPFMGGSAEDENKKNNTTHKKRAFFFRKTNSDYGPLIQQRQRIVLQLQMAATESGVVDGYRHNLLFHFFNTEIQLQDGDINKAEEALYVFNRGFSVPLSDKHLVGVVKSFRDHLDGYKYSSAKFKAEMVAVANTIGYDPDNILNISFNARVLKRNEKAAKIARAIELFREGWKLTRIGKLLEVHRNTVRRWIEKYQNGEIKDITSLNNSQNKSDEFAKSEPVSLACPDLGGKECNSMEVMDMNIEAGVENQEKVDTEITSNDGVETGNQDPEFTEKCTKNVTKNVVPRLTPQVWYNLGQRQALLDPLTGKVVERYRDWLKRKQGVYSENKDFEAVAYELATLPDSLESDDDRYAYAIALCCKMFHEVNHISPYTRIELMKSWFEMLFAKDSPWGNKSVSDILENWLFALIQAVEEYRLNAIDLVTEESRLKLRACTCGSAAKMIVKNSHDYELYDVWEKLLNEHWAYPDSYTSPESLCDDWLRMLKIELSMVDENVAYMVQQELVDRTLINYKRYADCFEVDPVIFRKWKIAISRTQEANTYLHHPLSMVQYLDNMEKLLVAEIAKRGKFLCPVC